MIRQGEAKPADWWGQSAAVLRCAPHSDSKRSGALVLRGLPAHAVLSAGCRSGIISGRPCNMYAVAANDDCSVRIATCAYIGRHSACGVLLSTMAPQWHHTLIRGPHDAKPSEDARTRAPIPRAHART